MSRGVPQQAWATASHAQLAQSVALFGVSLSRRVLVLETHTPGFTITGSVSPSTAISSPWLRGTGRWAPSRSTHWARAANPRWNACCALLGPFAARVAVGAGDGVRAGLTPSLVSRCSVDSWTQVLRQPPVSQPSAPRNAFGPKVPPAAL